MLLGLCLTLLVVRLLGSLWFVLDWILALVLLPLGIVRNNAFIFFIAVKRFITGKFSIFFLWFFVAILSFLILVFLLLAVSIFLAFIFVLLVVVEFFSGCVVVSHLLVLVDDFLHSDDDLLDRIVTISISHLFKITYLL